jgi:PPP family 3-phenylpropionic acid transporter
MSPGLSAAIRYAAFYGTVFLALGVYLPFWPVWLGARGLSSEQIGVLLALPAWVRIVGTPAIAQLTDRLGRPRMVLAVLAALSAGSFAALFLGGGFWPILLISLPAAICFTALVPLSESVTMAAVLRDRLDYGRIRLWGSIAFMIGTVGAGSLLSERNPDLILILTLGALLAAVVAAATLPRQPVMAVGERRSSPLALLRNRRFLLFLGTASLLQASHAAYYAFSAVHWQAAGLSGTTIGALWAEGVIAEIAFFAVSAPLFARAGPAVLLLVAGVAGIVRWSVLGMTTDLPALMAVQILHAATFGAAHFGAMHFIARAAPPNLMATAQGLYSAASGGLGLGLALLLAGSLYGIDQGSAFLAMAGLSLGGTLLAAVLRHRERRGPDG